MGTKRPMSGAEIRFFKESIIREYKQKMEKATKVTGWNTIFKKFRSIMPYNIVFGIVAIIIFLNMYGWRLLFRLFLWAVIMVTIFSAVIAGFIRKN